jgi:hypothetical protein
MRILYIRQRVPWLLVGLAIIYCIMLCSCFCNRTYPRLDKGLVLYLPFDGSIQDISGKGHSVTVTDVQLAEDRKGKKNSACLFSGRSFIEVDSSPWLDITNSITIAAWIKHDAVSNTISLRPQEEIVCKISTIYPWNKGYRLTAWWGNPDGYACELYDGSQHICSVGEYPVIGKWTHVATTWDGETMRLYQDGLQRSSIPFKGTLEVSESPLLVGIHTLKNQAQFQGLIDELRIYNRTLSAMEIHLLSGKDDVEN